ncbi:uncharacterized protein Z518_03533 [Rhinocladiella mackenziei CBS 650.93]|uniref:Flavin-containing monooxygenase n=1 Tax=Rhinocladiella mackenziei CBS 650.93 TaxID=1442369 RepID=A0A0D2IZN9_9EURO|nr:uncharacterized protein Z518_03533 [Rhinocladiella mackenziei CBS 650.93]KIX08876.1 hypothetical protein Z518_03533 [Rhinocladiella mackenziei CBS 650.93]
MATPCGSASLQPDLTASALPNEVPHENEWYRQDFEGYQISETTLYTRRPVKLVCVGAGTSGLQIANKAEVIFKDVEVVIYEKNDDSGGT